LLLHGGSLAGWPSNLDQEADFAYLYSFGYSLTHNYVIAAFFFNFNDQDHALAYQGGTQFPHSQG
jgi:hypothetical protein